MPSDSALPITDQPAVQDVPRPPVGARFVIPLAVAYFGVWVAWLAPLVLTLQVKVSELTPASRTGSLSLVLGVSSVLSLLAMPVMGRLSDRTLSRWGMRRPWLMGGALLGSAGTVIVAVAGSIPVLLVGWCITNVVLASLVSVVLAMLPDQVHADARGKVSGILGLANALGAIVSSGIAGALTEVSTAAAVLVPGLLGMLCVALACLLLKDRVLDPRDRPALSVGLLIRSYTFNPRRHPDFGWAWFSRFAIFLALAWAQTYQVFYLTGQVGLSQSKATAVVSTGVVTQTVCMVVGSLVFGPLSDRLRRRKVFVLASAVTAGAGLLALAFATTVPGYFLAMVLVGTGQGIYLAVDLALVTDVLPNKEADAAKDLGVFAVANLLPQSLAPAIAPAFLGIAFGTRAATHGNNFFVLFILGAVCALISAATVLPIRAVR